MAAQLPDRIFFNGNQSDLYSNPLEPYWNITGKKRPPLYSLPHCKRGYTADWEIKNNELFLTGIDGTFERRFIFFIKKSARYTLKTLFPRCRHRLVKAVWFSGKLRIPCGKMTMFEPTGYDSRFEKEEIITIEKGNVLKVVTLDFTQRTLVVNSEAT